MEVQNEPLTFGVRLVDADIDSFVIFEHDRYVVAHEEDVVDVEGRRN